MTKSRPILLLFLAVAILSSCREDDFIPEPDEDKLPEQLDSNIAGFYLLNEGNMNMNKASLDYYDYESGVYSRNIYGASNPTATLGLGDVGNDIGIYGSKLYAVINASNKVEVMDASTTKRLAVLEVKNCRYLTFDGGFAYVSAYDGEISIGTDKPNGFVAKYDTTNFELIGKVEVGRQPEEMAVSNGKLYIANSGGYSPPQYESTVSIIDLNTFKVVKSIEVAINLHRMKADGHGNIYVSSRGDYYDTPSTLHIIDTQTDQVSKTFDLASANLTIKGDTAYVIGSEFSYFTGDWTINYAMINTQTKEVLEQPFISQELIDKIKTPYGIAVDPFSGNIYITDAGDYVSPGKLYCYDLQADSLIFEQVTGDIPAHFAFVKKNNSNQK
jgi:DNA-binding beta-propeller fold protein YncE